MRSQMNNYHQDFAYIINSTDTAKRIVLAGSKEERKATLIKKFTEASEKYGHNSSAKCKSRKTRNM